MRQRCKNHTETLKRGKRQQRGRHRNTSRLPQGAQPEALPLQGKTGSLCPVYREIQAPETTEAQRSGSPAPCPLSSLPTGSGVAHPCRYLLKKPSFCQYSFLKQLLTAREVSGQEEGKVGAAARGNGLFQISSAHYPNPHPGYFCKATYCSAEELHQ